MRVDLMNANKKEVNMSEVKINLGVRPELSVRLKKIASNKGMKFHFYLNQELEKLAAREEKKQ